MQPLVSVKNLLLLKKYGLGYPITKTPWPSRYPVGRCFCVPGAHRMGPHLALGKVFPRATQGTVGKTSPSSLWPLSDSDQEPPVADMVGMKPSFRATHQLLPTDSNIPVLHPTPHTTIGLLFLSVYSTSKFLGVSSPYHRKGMGLYSFPKQSATGFAASITSELPSKELG